MVWRNCAASLTLAAEIDRRWPGRSTVSDGTIGDPAHAARGSATDHNAWITVEGVGVVRARDVTAAGIDMAGVMEYLRSLGAAGDPRLTGGGYLIFNRRITTPDWRGWRVYTGINPHVAHGHISFSRQRAGFDSTAPWGIAAASTGGDWSDMASKEDIRAVIREELGGTVWQTTTPLPNRRGPGGKEIPGGGGDTLFGMAINADGFGYRIERKLDELLALVRAAGADPAAIEHAVANALAGGLTVTSTIAPRA